MVGMGEDVEVIPSREKTYVSPQVQRRWIKKYEEFRENCGKRKKNLLPSALIHIEAYLEIDFSFFKRLAK